MQITLERQSKAIALSFNTDNSIAYDELYLAVQDKMSGIVNGGKFFVGKAFTIVGNAVSVLSKNIYVQGLTVAVAGGLGSRLAGGSFELGFLTAGLAFAVNQVVTELAQEEAPGTVKYNKSPPDTVPVEGETKAALQCFADTCLPGETLSVTGGQEQYDSSGRLLHSRNSTHYPENGARAVDLSTWREDNSLLTTETVNSCAIKCGFTHGQLERGHWHLQIGPGNGSLPLPMKEP